LASVTNQIEPWPFGQYRKIEIVVNAEGQASTATESVITLINGESGDVMFTANVATLADVFAKLGFNVQAFHYSPPRG